MKWLKSVGKWLKGRNWGWIWQFTVAMGALGMIGGGLGRLWRPAAGSLAVGLLLWLDMSISDVARHVRAWRHK